ncbi:MAG TPA: ClpXP protease specificity-enhancing factor [Ectothiorhodospiraceae bacterium]|nr:ClpXP protease specificity-enhancing factor [Ectothiorhodospiraceae bacterium]
MTSSRPYLIRALYEWISDNGLTPYILVDAEYENVVVPTQYVEKGKIVLNISLGAVENLVLGDSAVELDARFSGKSMQIFAPVESVLAIYARENGKGMVFGEDDGGDEPSPTPDKVDTSKSKRPKLHVVK